MNTINILGITSFFILLSLIIIQSNLVESCNEVICGSIVSKCMLLKNCDCDIKNHTCIKQCFDCLGYLFNDCCSCFELCSVSNETQIDLSEKSNVEEFDGMPALFDTLTSEPDDSRWMVVSFPIEFDNISKDLLHIQPLYNESRTMKICTVVYLNQCLSWNKCRANCLSMGSSSYRWFNDGCCECIGTNCINYGINKSQCLECSGKSREDEEPYWDDDDLDYGVGRTEL